MRIGLIAALVILGYLAARAEAVTITAPVPTSIELVVWCWRFPDAACRRQAADAARAHCRETGANARFVRSALLQRTFTHGQEGWFLFDCIRDR